MLCVAPLAHAAPESAPAAAAGPLKLNIPFTRYVLPNGLVVILQEDRTLPEVVVNLWYHVGSKDEKPGRTGFAHLFEHLMFMGSEHVPYDLDQGAGLFDMVMEAQGGENNASTDSDRTNYYESGPPRLLETFLWLEADRMATLADGIDQTKLGRQRKIVQNERRQSYENRPYGKASLVIPEEMYPADHPYHHDTIGSHEDLEAATVGDVRAFFHRYYVPTNASLLIAGDFDPAEAKRLVEHYFGWIPQVPSPEHTTSAPPAHLGAPKEKTLTDKVELPRTYLVYHAPASYAPGSAECDVIAAVLGQGKSSRLQRVLRLEKQIAEDVNVECETRKLGGLLSVVVTARPGHSLQEIEKAVDEEIAGLKKAPPAAAELDRAVANVETTFARLLEPLSTRADVLQQYEDDFHDPGRVAWDLARYRKVTPAQVREWAQKLLDPNARLVLHVVPEKEKK
jgi:zinc protease